MWKWSTDNFIQQQPNNPQEDVSSDIEPSSSSISESDIIDDSNSTTHTITFKCIGATRDSRYQEVLRAAKLIHDSRQVVETRLQPEPDNIFDPKAIAFQCYINGKWSRIGYVAKVLDARSSDKIVSTQLAWVKYVTMWTGSGPGYFAGIDITRRGCWSSTAMRSRSTI